MISVRRGQGCPCQYILAIWTFFVRPWAFLPSWHRPWAWCETGQGHQTFWPHNSSSKSWCLAPREGRRILMFLAYIMVGRVSFPVGIRASSPTQGMLLAFWCMRCAVIDTFMGWCRLLRYIGCAFNGAFMRRHWLSGWGFPWKLGGIYFAWNSPSSSFVRRKFPPDFTFYIKCLGRTITLHLQAPESCRNSKFLLSLHEPKMPLELWVSQLRQRKQRPKIFLSFNRGRKRTLLLQSGTVAGADCVRSLMNL